MTTNSDLSRRVESTNWQIVDVTFTTANVDVDIAHRLSPSDPEQLDYLVLDCNGPPLVYRDTSPSRNKWVAGVIRLRSGIAGLKARIKLTIPLEPKALIESATVGLPVGLTIADVINTIYPVGSIYISENSTSPQTLFGVGTWAVYGAGRVPVFRDSGDTAFDVAGETGGAKTHTLAVSEMPAHNHTGSTVFTSTSITDTHYHNAGASGTYGVTGGGSTMYYLWDNGNSRATSGTAGGSITASSSSTPSIASQGGGGAHNNLQPYIVVYAWKRTA